MNLRTKVKLGIFTSCSLAASIGAFFATDDVLLSGLIGSNVWGFAWVSEPWWG